MAEPGTDTDAEEEVVAPPGGEDTTETTETSATVDEQEEADKVDTRGPKDPQWKELHDKITDKVENEAWDSANAAREDSSRTNSGMGGHSDGSRYASGEGSDYLDEGDWNDAYKEIVGDKAAYTEIVEDYIDQGGPEGTGMSFEEFLAGEVWDKALDNKGLGLEETQQEVKRLTGLRDRDSQRWWEDPSEWQTSLDEDMKTAMREMAQRSAYGGNYHMASQALQNAVQQTRAKMTDYIAGAREDESAAAGKELTSLLHVAAQRGEQAGIQREMALQQAAQARAQLAAQNTATWMSFFGSLLATAAMIGISISDERTKTETGGDTGGQAYNYLDKMKTATYNQDPAVGDGQSQNETGVMAQSFSGSQMGQQALVQGPGGMMGLNQQQVQKNTMVAQKELHERLKMLESRLGINRRNQANNTMGGFL